MGRHSLRRRPGDPLNAYFKQGYDHADLRHRDLTQFAPPRDPVRVAKAEHRRHYNQATGYTLYPDSVIPCGLHLGKTLRRVPKSELQLYWTHRAALTQWPEWRAVIDYLDRFPESIE